MPLTEKQLEYLLRCNHRWNVKTGATGSGKTFVDTSATIPKRFLALRGEGLAVLMGNTRGTLERNILSPMREMWGSVLVGDIHSDNTVNLFGKTAYALGADNKKHVARIQGATMEYVYGDEVTTWAQDVFQMLKSRLRCKHSHFDGTCNPDSPRHWFKKFLDSDADIYQQRYVIDDGALAPEIIEELKKEYAGTVFYNRFILGQWVRAEGLVYPMFDRSRHITQNAPSAGRFWISVDYGILNPFSAGLWCLVDGVAVRVAEYYYDGRAEKHQRTDEEHYAEVKKLAGDRYIQRMVVDPSAASFIEVAYRHKDFPVEKADNSVIPGIAYTASLLNQGKIKIHVSCKDGIREFETYSWDEKKVEDAVVKEFDHAMDDTRYFAYTILRNVMR